MTPQPSTLGGGMGERPGQVIDKGGGEGPTPPSPPLPAPHTCSSAPPGGSCTLGLVWSSSNIFSMSMSAFWTCKVGGERREGRGVRGRGGISPVPPVGCSCRLPSLKRWLSRRCAALIRARSSSLPWGKGDKSPLLGPPCWVPPVLTQHGGRGISPPSWLHLPTSLTQHGGGPDRCRFLNSTSPHWDVIYHIIPT